MEAEFKGKPLIEIPKNIPSYNFLTGDFGKEFLEEYNRIVKSDYKDNSNLNILNFSDDVVEGSNIYSVYLANKILFQYGLRTATPVDVQKIIDRDKNFLRGYYIDLGMVLRTKDGANKYLSEQIAKQAKKRGYEFSNKLPLVFKPSDLELILDNNSPSGLGFRIKESASPFNASELSNENDYKKFNETNEKGVPIFDKNGNRTNYTRRDGLSRFVLVRDLGLVSWVDFLVGSSVIGRVVVLDA